MFSRLGELVEVAGLEQHQPELELAGRPSSNGIRVEFVTAISTDQPSVGDLEAVDVEAQAHAGRGIALVPEELGL